MGERGEKSSKRACHTCLETLPSRQVTAPNIFSNRDIAGHVKWLIAPRGLDKVRNGGGEGWSMVGYQLTKSKKIFQETLVMIYISSRSVRVEKCYDEEVTRLLEQEMMREQ